MIHFELLEDRLSELHTQFLGAKPFPFIALDGFANVEKLRAMMLTFPRPDSTTINKSRDYIFAKNKYEKSNFKNLGAEYSELHKDLTSSRFQDILRAITGESLFIDPAFHGGGLHQGGVGSFLDMHADFNYHPLHEDWFRNINAILYLNDGWKPEWKGQLKLRHAQTGEATEIEPLFNRCIIMFTRAFTLHGYDTINFPQGHYRRSIAAYAYSPVDRSDDAPLARSTVWYPENTNFVKRAIGRSWPLLVKYKNRLIGSGTAKNH